MYMSVVYKRPNANKFFSIKTILSRFSFDLCKHHQDSHEEMRIFMKKCQLLKLSVRLFNIAFYIKTEV